MKIGFVINSFENEQAAYTTTRLSMAAVNMGHEVWTMSVADFVYDPDGSVHARARGVSQDKYDDREAYFEELTGKEGKQARISCDELDALMLRNDPAEDAERPWAQISGVLFGQLAAARGVIVLNDPTHLTSAINKTYFQHFPDKVRPRTCISRNMEEIEHFIASQGGNAVIKPLQGSGGHSVFLVREGDKANIHQMIEAVIRDGYAVAQEFLPEGAKGDIRMFAMNGRPLLCEGKYAAFRRVNQDEDIRSNMHAGGKAAPAEIGPVELSLVEAVGPKLVRDGMFLVGLDIVGDKLMEINVFSPGGLGSAQALTGVDFAPVIIRDIERKVRHKDHYRRDMPNAHIATL